MPLGRNRITYSNNPNHAARSAHAKGDRAFRTYDTSHIRPKRNTGVTIAGIAVLAVILAAIVFGAIVFIRGCSPQAELLPEGQSAQVVVTEGESARDIAQSLVEAHLISNSKEFTDRVSALNAASQLQPGVYTLTGGMTLDQIIATLKTPVQAKMFTIPEGYTLAQIAQTVADASEGRIAAADFVAAASDASAYAGSYPFLAGAGNHSLEGYLFPQTYPINADATADSIIRMMLSQFAQETAGLNYSYAESHGLSAYDVVILASIIERETDTQYRETVSSVFYNRMADGMMLQSDATMAYVFGHEPTPEDLQSDDPHNTYTNAGLPPTPICSPSLGCLQAACNPESTDYYYFFIAPDSSGEVQHYFSETYDEHIASFS